MRGYRLPIKRPRLTVRKKLLISFFVFIFSPLCVLTIVTYLNVAKTIENNVHYSAVQSFNQAYDLLTYKVNAMVKASNLVYSNPDVQNVLSSKESETDIIQQNKDMLLLEQLFNNLIDPDNVYRVTLYTQGWLMFSNQKINFDNLDQFQTTPEYQKMLTNKDMVLWLPPESVPDENNATRSADVISLIRKIHSQDNYRDVIGVIRVSILKSDIEKVLNKANVTPNGITFLQNSESSLIGYSNTSVLSANDYLSQPWSDASYRWGSVQINKKPFLINSEAIDNTDWKLVTIIPLSDIYSASNHIRNLILVLAIVLGGVSFCAAYLISVSITRRIVLLTRKMSLVQQGDLDVSVNVASRSQDEISKLIENFNYMLKRIKWFMNEQYVSSQIIKNTELKVLQAQINPHFLYNMLDLIHWKALDYNAAEISDISQSLAKFYRTGLSKGKLFVTFEEEVEHLRSYVEIQNMRFSDCIHLQIDISQEVYPYHILKMILQPLVENAILHGILESEKTEGIIVFRAALIGADILLTIEDNGVGMSGATIQGLLNDTSAAEHRGYGIRNINQRIKLCYGQKYSLTFRSVMGAGTTVTVLVPAWTAEDFERNEGNI